LLLPLDCRPFQAVIRLWLSCPAIVAVPMPISATPVGRLIFSWFSAI